MLADRKTIFDLDEIITRCFEEAKKMGYISKSLGNTKELLEGKLPVPIIVNERELVHHIALTVVGELYELEIIRRIAPIFRENRALSADFQQFGESFQLFYDKALQDLQLRTMRIQAEGGD